jgi:hypothetical protein
MQASKVSASFKQGMTTDTSGLESISDVTAAGACLTSSLIRRMIPSLRGIRPEQRSY